MFNNRIKAEDNLKTELDPTTKSNISANRNKKIYGTTGETMVVFLGNNPVGKAAKYIQDQCIKKFGEMKIGDDFIADENVPESEIGFAPINNAHTTLGSMRVIDAASVDEWKPTEINKDKMKEVIERTRFSLVFSSLKLNSDGSVVIQWAQSNELQKFREELANTGADIKRPGPWTAVTLGYFPNLVNANVEQLQKIKDSFNDICTHLPSNVIANLNSGLKVQPENISFVTFARNNLDKNVIQSNPIIDRSNNICSDLSQKPEYPHCLITKREKIRKENLDKVFSKINSMTMINDKQKENVIITVKRDKKIYDLLEILIKSQQKNYIKHSDNVNVFIATTINACKYDDMSAAANVIKTGYDQLKKVLKDDRTAGINMEECQTLVNTVTNTYQPVRNAYKRP